MLRALGIARLFGFTEILWMAWACLERRIFNTPQRAIRVVRTRTRARPAVSELTSAF
jgi:hypothetical protein